MQKKIIFLFIFFSCSTHLFAQKDSISIVAKEKVENAINPLAPAKAAFYSALVPGLGQAYNKKYWKIPIVYAGLGAGIYFYSWNHNKYKGFRNEYKRRLAGTADPNHPIYGNLDDDVLIRGQKFHQKNRDLSALITAGIYILNIVDANVDAHLIQFNVNDNLSLKPQLNENDWNAGYNYGLSLSYQF